MSRWITRCVVVLLAFSLVVPGALASQTAKKRPGARKTKLAPAPEPPAPPPPPPTPEQLPAKAPTVTYNNGQLTIISQNSTLGDILSAVRARTGTAIEMQGTASERVATRLGPGSTQEVLGSLLHGSRFDYIILGSADDPRRVERVILTPRQRTPQQTAGVPPGQNPVQPTPVYMVAPSNEEEDDTETTPAPVEIQPQPAPQQPPQPRTPEELLQELQRMQQQQQQQPNQQPQQQPQ